MSADRSSTGITNSYALKTSLPGRTWKPPRCTRMPRCSGAYGAEGKESGDQWVGRDRTRSDPISLIDLINTDFKAGALSERRTEAVLPAYILFDRKDIPRPEPNR